MKVSMQDLDKLRKHLWRHIGYPRFLLDKHIEIIQACLDSEINKLQEIRRKYDGDLRDIDPPDMYVTAEIVRNLCIGRFMEEEVELGEKGDS